MRAVALGNLAGVQVELGEHDRAAQTLTDAERAIEDFRVQESGFASRFWLAQGKLLESRCDLRGG